MHRLTYVNDDCFFNSVFFQLFAMPGDPVVLEGVTSTLSAADLLNAVAMNLPLFCPENIKMWFIQAESQLRRALPVSQGLVTQDVCSQ